MATSTGGQPVPSQSDRLVRTAWVVGVVGLVPFVLMAGLILYAGRDFIAFASLVLALSGYSAVILSFLGGIRWGAALAGASAGRATLILSVLPAPVGWLILFIPSPWMFAAFAVAFALQGAFDVAAARHGSLPAWTGRLRLLLTAAVILCFAAAFVGTY